jgi:hypothetical protein
MPGIKGAIEAIRNRPFPQKKPFEPDLNDDQDWSEEDVRDLKAAWCVRTDTLQR